MKPRKTQTRSQEIDTFLKQEKINLAKCYFKAIKNSDFNLINSCESYARQVFGYRRKDLERIMRVYFGTPLEA